MGRAGEICVFTFGNGQSGSSCLPSDMTQISVGVNDVWGINGGDQIFRRDPNTDSFVQIGGALAQIAVGGDGVWGINSGDEIFHFDSTSGSWVQIIGSLKSIAVGSGAGVWGINSENQVFGFVRP